MQENGYRSSRRRHTGTDKIPLIMLLILLACIIGADWFFKLDLNWVDYTIIGIVFLSAFIGYVKGLISAVFSLVGYVAAVICAVLFSEPVALFIMKNTRITELIAEKLRDIYSGISVPVFSQSLDLSSIQNNSQMLEQIPELQKFLQDNSMFGQLFEKVNPLESASQAISGALTSITDILVFSILKVISVIAVFFVVKLAVVIVGMLVNSLISQSNFLSTTNKTIGLVLGAIIGCLVVFVICSYIVPFIGSMNIIKIPAEYQQSKVVGWLSQPPVF
ncbi:MAG: CvpA family protein [Clostridiaceae bacterium]|nr:CvpA family protein [Clostridiaceae bacterium]